ncbi:MAG TPA: ABC transporter substrate-binding protein [Candidatus Limnocylindria bacterium]|nr:ABC transporter substrate-binding protein [Candidatus Limnocylindria bacterium]
MKKTVALLVLLTLALFATVPAGAGTAPLRIGIAQFADHPSLDNCREGFLLGLAEAGFVDGQNIEVNVQNAQADMGLAAIIASTFVDNGYDLICAIATPMAITAVNTSDGKVPVIFSAVSAPIEAGLAGEDGLSELNTTGTSDQIPVRDQLALIRALQPEAKTIGLLYTVGEINSQVQAAQYREAAPEFGFEVVEATVTAGADVALAVPGLVQRVDSLSMLTDNTVVQYLDVVLDAADAAGVPVYGSEIEQVKRGGVATVGIDYLELGRQTGLMAARVLKGESAGSIPFEILTDFAHYYNAEALERLGLTIPEALMDSMTEVGAE